MTAPDRMHASSYAPERGLANGGSWLRLLSACATAFSRLAQRSLAFRPANSLDHLK